MDQKMGEERKNKYRCQVEELNMTKQFLSKSHLEGTMSVTDLKKLAEYIKGKERELLSIEKEICERDSSK
jgi:hypothetical protein